MTDLRRLKRTLMVATVCLLMLLSAARAVAPVRAQPLNRAAILVNYGDRTETYCVAFPEAQISGVELLRRAGLEVVGNLGEVARHLAGQPQDFEQALTCGSIGHRLVLPGLGAAEQVRPSGARGFRSGGLAQPVDCVGHLKRPKSFAQRLKSVCGSHGNAWRNRLH